MAWLFCANGFRVSLSCGGPARSHRTALIQADDAGPGADVVMLTAGVGGSLLSVGSAAGVALLGQAKGVCTLMIHLKWMPAILLGYAALIAAHVFINAQTF